MALNCIKNKVSYRYGCEPITDALLLNDLPGFTLSDAEWITTEERQTGTDVLNAAIRMGAEKVEEDVAAFLWPSVTPVDSWENKTVGDIADNLVVKTGTAGKLWGQRIRLDQAPYLSFYLNSARYFPTSTGTGTLKVINVLTGVEMYSQSVSFIGQQINTFEIDKEFRVDGQIIDIVVVITANTSVYEINAFNRGNCGSCSGRYLNTYVWADMIQYDSSDAVIDKNLRSISHTGGLILSYNLRCDIADYICGLSVGLKRAVWYAAGIALMDEVIMGKRINSLTTVDKDDAISLRERYVTEYGNIMSRVTQTAKLPKNPCFFCNPAVIPVNRIP